MGMYREHNDIFPIHRDIDDQIDEAEAIGID